MIILPKIKGYVSLTAHPVGCKANVSWQVDYIKKTPLENGCNVDIVEQGEEHCEQVLTTVDNANVTCKNDVQSQQADVESGYKVDTIKPIESSPLPDKAVNVLVIGGTTGYGLASALVASWGYNAKVIVVGYEKQAANGRTATAGMYNSASYVQLATQENKYVKVVLGDAFGDKCKNIVADIIKQDMGQVDLIVYSLASPRRVMPDGDIVHSVLKPIGSPYTGKSVVVDSGVVNTVSVDPATEEEIVNTVKVMGGDDWSRWIDKLLKQDLVAKDAITVAYSYIGPSLTHAIYKDGTIGRAKSDLKSTAERLSSCGIRAYVSVQKAVVTQASSAIPVVPLYISILFDVMKRLKTHEGCVQQIVRLYNRLYSNKNLVDTEGYIRLDDWEMDCVVQEEVIRRWDKVDTDNINQLADIAGYKADFLKLFGFGIEGVDYGADVDEIACENNVVWV